MVDVERFFSPSRSDYICPDLLSPLSLLAFENVTRELSSNPVPAFSNGGVWFPPTEVMHASSASGHGQMF